MFKPEKEQSDKSKILVDKVFCLCNPGEDFTVVYGYNIKQGVLSKKTCYYVIGFSEPTLTMIIIPITKDGDMIDKITVSKRTIVSIKSKMDSHVCIRVPEGVFSMIVPAYTPTTLESAGVLPIIQEKEAEAFHKFIKVLK